jgi:hypothetical protein
MPVTIEAIWEWWWDGLVGTTVDADVDKGN